MPSSAQPCGVQGGSSVGAIFQTVMQLRHWCMQHARLAQLNLMHSSRRIWSSITLAASRVSGLPAASECIPAGAGAGGGGAWCCCVAWGAGRGGAGFDAAAGAGLGLGAAHQQQKLSAMMSNG